MIKRLLYILSIYFTNGYFWIFMGFISMILLSLVMMSSLQASDVQGWVEAALGSDEVSTIKAGIDASIAKKISPTSVTKILT